MKVRISKEDCHNATIMAQDTLKLLEMMGISPRLENDKQSRLAANILGFKAEFVIARMFGCSLPTINIVTDGGKDLWVDGVSVDVKFSNREYGDLIFDNADKFAADLAILVGKISDEEMRVNGWIGRTKFLQLCSEHDYGYGKRLVMKHDELLPIGSLWEKLTERRMS